jgi:hypothetical protein
VLNFALALVWLISTLWHKCNPDFLIIVLYKELCLFYYFFALFSTIFPQGASLFFLGLWKILICYLKSTIIKCFDFSVFTAKIVENFV